MGNKNTNMQINRVHVKLSMLRFAYLNTQINNPIILIN